MAEAALGPFDSNTLIKIGIILKMITFNAIQLLYRYTMNFNETSYFTISSNWDANLYIECSKSAHKCYLVNVNFGILKELFLCKLYRPAI